ncbi:unnamed protein product [Aphanomyces euteiches]
MSSSHLHGLKAAPKPASKKHFRFQKGKERIAGLQSEVQLHAKTQSYSNYLLADETATAPFHEELTLLGELYTNERFQQCFRKLRRMTNSTAQLLYHLKQVLAVLEAQVTAYPTDADVMLPVLKLYVALAKDLQKEFYPHFATCLPQILAIINKTNPELTAEVFKALSMHFKHLQSQILADMHVIHAYYGVLLGHAQEYVRDFAANVFAVLLRKVKSGKEFKKYVSNYLSALVRGAVNDQVLDGSAKLFFAVMKNVQSQLHSRSTELLPIILDSFGPTLPPDHATTTYDVAKRTFTLLRKYTSAEYAPPVWKCLIDAVTRGFDSAKSASFDAPSTLLLSRQCNLMALFVSYKQGALADSDTKKQLVDIIEKLLVPCLDSSSEELSEAVLNLLTQGAIGLQGDFYRLLGVVYTTNASTMDTFTEKVLTLLPPPAMARHVVPKATLKAVQTLATESSRAEGVYLLGLLISWLEKHPELDTGVVLTLQNHQIVLDLAKVDASCPKTFHDTAATILADGDAWNLEDTSAFLARSAMARQVLMSLVYLKASEPSVVSKLVKNFISTTLDRIKGDAAMTAVAVTLRALALQVLGRMHRLEKTKLAQAELIALLQGQKTSSPAMVKAVEKFIVSSTDKDMSIDSWFSLLQSNLRSPCHALRRETLRLFGHAPALKFVATKDGTLEGKCDVVALCIQLEEAAASPSVDTERELIRVLDRLQVLSRSEQTPRLYVQLIVSHMLGLFHVKLSTVWPHVSSVIQAAVSLHFEAVWSILCDELDYVSSRTSEPEVPASFQVDESAHIVKALVDDCLVELGHFTDITDATTHHGLVWKALESFANLVETKSKVIVPIFCAFARDQYYALYPDDVDRVSSEDLTLFMTSAAESRKDNPKYMSSTNGTSYDRSVVVVHNNLTSKAVQAKLMSFLQLFRKFTNYAGVYGQHVLWDFFFSLLLKADDRIGRLALECLFAFKPAYLTPYRTQLLELADPKTFRETLTNFKVDRASGVLQVEHRASFFPVLLRLLYAKFITRKGSSRSIKQSLAHRRTTVLAFLVALDPEELGIFVDLICRPFQLKDDGNASSFTDQLSQLELVMENVSPSKQVGFLNVLEEVVGQLGLKITAYLPRLLAILTAILAHDDVGQLQKTQTADDTKEDEQVQDEDAKEDDEEDAETATSASNDNLRRQTRMLAFRRLTQMVDQFDGKFALEECFSRIFALCETSITHLPNVLRGAKKPPALLEWLRSIATSRNVAQVLTPTIVRTVVLCLATGSNDLSGISNDVLDCLLSFMDGLLTADETSGSTLLIAHLPHVLAQFVARFEAKTAKFVQDKHAGSSKKELNFLCRLGPHVSSNVKGEAADQLISLLLPFVSRNHKTSSTEKENIFDVVANLIPCVDRPHIHVNFLAKLLAPGPNCISEIVPRQKLMQVFVAIEQHPNAADLAHMCRLVVDLNANDARRLEEVDFEKRISAFQEINACKFEPFCDQTVKLVPLVSQYLQSMHDTEYSLRNAARTGLEHLVANAAKDNNATVFRVFETVIMPCIRVSLKSPIEDARRGFIQLLAVVADHFNGHETASLHGDLAQLRNTDDVEVDFFYNMTHIQAHRRLRAIQRLKSGFESGQLTLSNTTVHNVIVPLLQHVVYETKAQEGVSHEAAQCLGSASSLLSWTNYSSLLRNLLKQLPGRPDSETAIIAAICAIIDHFHFEGVVVTNGWKASKEERAATPEVETSHIQQSMIDSLLPMLKSFLTKDAKATKDAKTETTNNESILRVPIALAVVKLLRRLPVHIFYQEFPKLLIQVTKLLRSKDETIRASARTTLVRIAVELGPSYLLAIVSELEHSLQMGYMVHVLSYTLFAILEKVASACEQRAPEPLTAGNNSETPQSSPLDDCVPLIVNILVRDIFGDVGDERAEKTKSKTKEAKACRSFDSFELVARCINFLPNPTIHSLLLPVVQALEHVRSDNKGKVLRNVRLVLERVAIGLSKNASVETTHMYLYLFNMLNMCLSRITYLKPQDGEDTKRDDDVSTWLVLIDGSHSKKRISAWETFRIEAQTHMTGFDRYVATKAEAANSGADEILNYTVSLLYTMLKKDNSEAAASLLDPFVPLLLRCVAEIKHTDTVISALKCLAVMLNHPYPSLIASLSNLVDRVFKIIHRAGAATKNELTQACYRLLSVLIRERSEYQLDESQLRGLLSFLRHDIEEIDHQNATFGLLKAVLARRLVVAEVYDLMIRVGEMMVQSQVANVRTNCASMYLQFLLDYPLGDKRLNFHVRFVVNNLTFVFESGRLASMECLHALIKKLPSDMVDTRAAFFLLPLVLQLVNDDAAACRQLAANVIADLIKRVSAKVFGECVALVEPWWGNADPKLRCAAAQVSGLVLTARSDLAKKHATFLETLLAKLSSTLAQGLKAVGEQDEDSVEEVVWEPIYHGLLCIENLSTSLHQTFETWAPSVLDTIVELFSYPHAWVRLSAVRIFRGFVRRAKKTDTYLTQPGRLFTIAKHLCKQLESLHLSQDLITENVASLLYILKMLRAHPEIDQQVGETPHKQGGDEEEEEEGQDHKSSPVVWLFTRLSFMARGYQIPQRKTAVYKFFAGATVQEDSAFFETVLVQMINPLYRDINDEDDSKDEPSAEESSVKTLAHEVLQILEGKIESAAFLAAYSHVQKKVTEFRERRKQKRKIEAVANPEVAAKRKMVKNVRKQESKQLKKRKIGELKGTQNKYQKIAAAKERQQKVRPGHY